MNIKYECMNNEYYCTFVWIASPKYLAFLLILFINVKEKNILVLEKILLIMIDDKV